MLICHSEAKRIDGHFSPQRHGCTETEQPGSSHHRDTETEQEPDRRAGYLQPQMHTNEHR